ncbi:MAG TPA: peptide chain release factor N(5)-glutamine methyltransferase [Solirubrobacteraceae bacterium]
MASAGQEEHGRRADAPTARTAAHRGAHTVGDALGGAVTALAAAGCETPRLDAELLLAAVLDVGRERLLLDRELRVAGSSVRAFQDAVRRRAVDREPVAYILGRRGFRRLELAVDRRVLVPRPETELLVESVLEVPSGISVLEVGTGSGAVALALKDERPDLEVTATDVSAEALEVARANGLRLDLDVGWLHADLLAGVPDAFDAVVANLPYVAESERFALAPEITRHEPAQALFAGADGLAAIAAMLAQLESLPRVGLLALEVGAGQSGAVAAMARTAGFQTVRSERDLAGIERVVLGQERRR